MNTIKLSDYGTDISSRYTGVSVRESILNILSQGADKIVIDCGGVRTLSESFSDEVFGILVLEQGKEWFRKNITLVGLSDLTKKSIIHAIAERLQAATC